MRVLYLNPFSQEVSGPDESLLTLLGALVPLGVEPHVVLPHPGPQVPRYQALGAKVHFAPLTILKRALSPLALALLPARLVRGSLAVARIARRERIDLIHTNMEVVLDGAVASKLLRIPHVLHYRGNTNGEPRLVFDALTRFWTATSERVFCISNATANIFRTRERDRKVEVLYNPVAIDTFMAAERSGEVRAELGAGPEDFLAGTVGRIHPRKDLVTFLRAGAIAAPAVPRLKLAIVGSAEVPEEIAYERRLRQLAGDLGIVDRVRFAGARSDMPAVMKALDLFVLSSRHEGFGRVAPEAMAAGVPVVLTREGAFPELIAEGQEGYLAAPEDAEEFSARMIQLASDATARRTLGERGAISARRFAPENAARRVWARYSELASGDRPRADSFDGSRGTTP